MIRLGNSLLESGENTSLTPPGQVRRQILVANSKGGCGKSTLSMNLSAAFARRGLETCLVDCDPQQTSSFWLSRRPENAPVIHGMSGVPDPSRPVLGWELRVPRGIERLVIDSPGGLSPSKLSDYVARADAVVIPVMPSAIDIHATTHFIKAVFLSPGFRKQRKPLYVIGNRVEKRNKYFHELNRFLRRLAIEDAMLVPNSYAFLRCADEGLGLVDLKMHYRYREAVESIQQIVDKTERAYERCD